MNEPIKLPLRITDDNRAGDIYLGTDDNKHMIMVLPQLPGREPAKAIAEYMVLACNSRKDLLTACETSAICFRKLAGIGMLSSSKHVLLDNVALIKAAIEKSGRM